MLKVFITVLIAGQLLLTWKTDTVDAQRGRGNANAPPRSRGNPNAPTRDPYPNGEPSCGFCPEYQVCGQFLKDDNCAKAPCEFTPRCISTAGGTCASVSCFNGRCYEGRICERGYGCRIGPRCIPVD